MKSGPNGPALATSNLDVAALRERPDLIQCVSKYLSNDNVQDLAWYYHNLPTKAGLKLSKLAFLQEGGGKTRVIAIADYWSQLAMFPIHKRIMSILRRLETDGTYDQGKQVDRIVSQTLTRNAYCFDLSAATDRFPVKLQEILLAQVYESTDLASD